MDNNILISKTLKAGGRTYYFDLKISKNEKFYLTIKEYRLYNGGIIDNMITIFEDNLYTVKNVFDEMLAVIDNDDQVLF